MDSERSAKGDKIFKTFNPKLNIENSINFHEASSEEIDNAVAWPGKLSNLIKTYSGERKGEFLNAIADEIEALGQELIKRLL